MTQLPGGPASRSDQTSRWSVISLFIAAQFVTALRHFPWDQLKPWSVVMGQCAVDKITEGKCAMSTASSSVHWSLGPTAAALIYPKQCVETAWRIMCHIIWSSTYQEGSSAAFIHLFPPFLFSKCDSQWICILYIFICEQFGFRWRTEEEVVSGRGTAQHNLQLYLFSLSSSICFLSSKHCHAVKL